ncbi:hypothetical protein ASPCADRAFT_9368 [Aspergillus carbonarius ITEM 5010]|uniref:Uncharacterized protein n=1 Tax=Aspergillus carbonarius (strain ITEM 5010) TaxID=602072 RepID=A0A1R3RBW0_ASPC5|nr:hypothetical protein ASPCADRAFT_9368 [Aspergillus carbonarius ITEM 5010]
MSFLQLVDDTFERAPYDPAAKITAESKASNEGKGTQEAPSMEEPIANLTAKIDATAMIPAQEDLDGSICSLPSKTEAPETPVQNQDPSEDDMSRVETTSVDYMTPYEGEVDPTSCGEVLDNKTTVTAVQSPTPDTDGTAREINEDKDEPDMAPLLGHQHLTPYNLLFAPTSPCTRIQDSTEDDQIPHASTEDQKPTKDDTHPIESVNNIIDRINTIVTDAIDTTAKTPMGPASPFTEALRASTAMAGNTSHEVSLFAPTDKTKVALTPYSKDTSVEVPISQIIESTGPRHQRLRLTYPNVIRSRVRVKGPIPVIKAEATPKHPRQIMDINPESSLMAAAGDTQPTTSIRIGYDEDSHASVEFEGYGSQVEIIWRE